MVGSVFQALEESREVQVDEGRQRFMYAVDQEHGVVLMDHSGQHTVRSTVRLEQTSHCLEAGLFKRIPFSADGHQVPVVVFVTVFEDNVPCGIVDPKGA